MITVDKKCDVTRFVSDDPERFNLAFLRVSADDGFVEATNGHLVARVDLPTQEFGPKGELLVHVDTARAVFRAAGKEFVLAKEVRELEPDTIVAHGADAKSNKHTIACPADDPTFPDTDAVIPRDPPTVRLGLSACYLREIGAFAAKHGAAGTSTVIEVSVRDPFGPVEFAFDLNTEGRKARVYLMTALLPGQDRPASHRPDPADPDEPTEAVMWP